eukprot:6192814-Pleurochrysis_carterae.AAC.2
MTTVAIARPPTSASSTCAPTHAPRCSACSCKKSGGLPEMSGINSNGKRSTALSASPPSPGIDASRGQHLASVELCDCSNDRGPRAKDVLIPHDGWSGTMRLACPYSNHSHTLEASDMATF